MKRMTICAATIAILVSTAGARAQNTLGELLDAGAKKLSRQQIHAVFSGARSIGRTQTGVNGEFEFKADGTYAAVVLSPSGSPSGMRGKWAVTDGDQMCVEWTSMGRSANKGSGCGYYYSLDGAYYLSDSDADRSVPVLKRTLRK